MYKSKKSKRGQLFVISAPTGGGKSTLVAKTLASLQKKFHIARIVTYTTRPPRPGEEAGKDYHFVSHEQFEKLEKDSFFTEVTAYNTHVYGSPRNFLEPLEQGTSFIAITDRAGIAFYKTHYPFTICIWITPPNLATLTSRLTKRGSETPESLQRRLQLAEQEMQAEIDHPLCTEHLINDELEASALELQHLIEHYFVPTS